MKLKDIPIPTLVTGIAGVAWLGSFGLRALKPDFALGPAADTMFATCVAWFAKTRLAKEGQDDLLSEVLTKSVVPFISTAHADDPEPPKPAQPYTPKPVQPAPKPSSPKPKPGGMPWGP
jgi:hypothetical protein